MENEVKKITEHYSKNLKAVEYHSQMHTILHEEKDIFTFMLTFIHDVIQSGRFKGTKLLEIGSGATVHSIASASKYFSNIVQSDLVEDNVENLRNWHKGDTILDWSLFLEIVAELEGCERNDLTTHIKNMESRIRSTVKAVVRCDVLSDSVLHFDGLGSPAIKPPYDLIISTLCLEAAAPDFQGYVDIMKRLSKLLKKGGGIIICGFENGGAWKVLEKEFHQILLTLNNVEAALDKAGFVNRDFKTSIRRNDCEWYFKYDSLFCVAAEKL